MTLTRRLIPLFLLASLVPLAGQHSRLGELFDRQPKARPKSGQEIQLEQEFISIFGPRPGGSLGWEKRVETTEWETAKEHFQGVAPAPDTFTQEAADTYVRWNLGEPVFYKGRYGLNMAFPNAGFIPAPLAIPVETHSAAIISPHLVIAQAQADALRKGVCLPKLHPYLKFGRFAFLNRQNCDSLPVTD